MSDGMEIIWRELKTPFMEIQLEDYEMINIYL